VLSFGPVDLRPDTGKTREWLVTNGLGGYAASTIIGQNTRKYHGLLVAALHPPVDRRVLLTKVDEEIQVGAERYTLAVNETAGGYIDQGYQHLFLFEARPVPTFWYKAGPAVIQKRVFMVYGQNTVVCQYSVFPGADQEIRITLLPFVAFRDYHWTLDRTDWPFFMERKGHQIEIQPYSGGPMLYLYCQGAPFEKEGFWWERLFYPAERARGLNSEEDLFVPGRFSVSSTGSQVFYFVASSEPIEVEQDWGRTLAGEIERQDRLLQQANLSDPLARELVLAADQFIVWRKSTDTKTVIAGYPWFTDWGRDTMIALPGLTLATNRLDDAREILAAFGRNVQDGLLPNMFPDAGVEPAYNTVDAPLWYFFAVHKYFEYGGDQGFVREEFFPALEQIMAGYVNGTRFGIGMDEDGLIRAGEEGWQLTWMDAKVGDWVVTPRRGKPVEINALWYNALCIFDRLCELFKVENEHRKLISLVKESFGAAFWNETEHCLYDVVNGDEKDARIRPNQILAVSLPFALLDHGKEKAVVNKVWQALYAVYGLRTLSPESEEFRSHYQGDQWERDSAYHQGTAWSWLMGPFITAYLKVNKHSRESVRTAEALLMPLQGHLREHGVGSVSEVFDALPPYTPGGCFAQAWGVSEILRAYVEGILTHKN